MYKYECTTIDAFFMDRQAESVVGELEKCKHEEWLGRGLKVRIEA